jgi:hypothetical protein
VREFVGRHQSGEFRIDGDIGGKSGQQLAHGGRPAIQIEVDPVIGQQPGGQLPVPRRLGLPHPLDRVPVLGEPLGGRGMEPRRLMWCDPPQLGLQQVGEQLVVPEPMTARRPGP